jgi:hypothetical protein
VKPVRFSQHARVEIARRGVPFDIAEGVLRNPQQVVPTQGGLMALQSRVELEGKQYLVRVVVAERPDVTVVVTVYRTSKIGKYWRSE